MIYVFFNKSKVKNISSSCFCNRSVYCLLFFLSFIFNGYAQDYDNEGVNSNIPETDLQENVSQNKTKIYITEGTKLYGFDNQSSVEVAYISASNKEKKHKTEARIAKKETLVKKRKADAPIAKKINYIYSKNSKHQFVLLESKVIAGLGGSKDSKKQYIIRNSNSHVYSFAFQEYNYNTLFLKNNLPTVYKFTESIRPPPVFFA
ncbi:hypothetical protein [Epilithonimonas sp. UC225_85]|uniref:hypothetical protein n=1 Tax=Epilithonimonas sp. UC225_85 TaxID=3350167 RepID=UPI0036D3EFF0